MFIKSSLAVYILAIFILLSCKEVKRKNDKDDENSKLAKELVSRYNAITDWDTTLLFTFQYQKMFIEENNLMFFKGRIFDIIKKDSNYVIKVLDEREDASHNFLALITATSEQLDALYKDDKSTKGVFIIKVTNVTSSMPSIKQDEGNVVDSDGDDQTYTFTHLSDDADQMITIFRGKMIDSRFEKFSESK